MVNENSPDFLEIISFPLIVLKHFFIAVILFFKQFIYSEYKSLVGKVALVTGAGNGLGRELCLSLAREGCVIVGVDVDVDGMIATRSMLVAGGGDHVRMIACDLRREVNVQHLRQLVGPVDLLICNAGVVTAQPLLQFSPDKFQEIVDVNFFSSLHLVQKFVPDMVQRDSDGHVVFVGSIAGSVSAPGLSGYCASKAALHSLVETLWLENRDSGLHVTLATPYQIGTGMFHRCYARLGSVFPILNPVYVAEKIVAAVRKNQYHIAIGRLMYFLVFLKSILPSEALYELYRFSGSLRLMSTFEDQREALRQKHYSAIEDRVEEIP